MQKYYVITIEPNTPKTETYFSMDWKYLPFAAQPQFPLGVNCYWCRDRETAEQLITREFLQGNNAQMYETHTMQKQLVELIQQLQQFLSPN
jgi:hypothetical protein